MYKVNLVMMKKKHGSYALKGKKMNRLISTLLISFMISTSAFAMKATPDNTHLFFVYCGNGNGYFKKIDWKELGKDKPMFLKKGEDTFRVEVFFSRDEKTYDALTKIKGADVIEYYLRKDGNRLNGTFQQSENDIPEKEKMFSIASDYYLGLYLVKKDVPSLLAVGTALKQCNEDSKNAQGTGDLSKITNKKTLELNELEIAPAPSEG